MSIVTYLLLHPELLAPLLGIGLSIHVEAIVEYLKANWFLPRQSAPFIAAILSAVIQIGLCAFYGLPFSDAMIGTIVATASACWYHELSS